MVKTLTRKGKKKHLKRKPAPKNWPIHRKEFLWTIKPKPGPHPISGCIPLLIIVREILGMAKTRREAKNIISQGKLAVNGKPRRDESFPVGLMDVVSIPEIDRFYRIIPSKKGLFLHPIDKKESEFRLCRIEDKSIINGGYLQLNLHDGTNLTVKDDSSGQIEDTYKTLDDLKLSIPEQEVLDYLKLVEGASIITLGGENMGKYGILKSIEEKKSQKRRHSLVTIEEKNGESFQTILDFIFAIGYDEPCISLPEVI